MTYAIIKTINGSYYVHAEGFTDVAVAKTVFHTLCANLWNAPDAETACVMITDQNLNVVEGYREFITHAVEPTPVVNE